MLAQARKRRRRFVTSKLERSKGAMNMTDQLTNPRHTGIPTVSLWQLGLAPLPAATEKPSRETPAPAPGSDRPVHVQLVYVSPEERRAAELAKAAPPPRAQSQRRKPSREKRRVRRKPARKSRLLGSRELHETHCSICASPYREAIDEEFTSWHNVSTIAYDYKIERRVIYRHAHAMGLFAIRDRNVRLALGHIIEEAERISPSADSVLRAVRMLSQIDENGVWVEPPAHVIVSSGTALQTRNPLPRASK
jgi:hypothetical protein